MVDRIFDSRLSANERTAAMVSGGGGGIFRWKMKRFIP